MTWSLGRRGRNQQGNPDVFFNGTRGELRSRWNTRERVDRRWVIRKGRAWLEAQKVKHTRGEKVVYMYGPRPGGTEPLERIKSLEPSKIPKRLKKKKDGNEIRRTAQLGLIKGFDRDHCKPGKGAKTTGRDPKARASPPWLLSVFLLCLFFFFINTQAKRTIPGNPRGDSGSAARARWCAKSYGRPRKGSRNVNSI